jgi:hypothetical protein
MCSLTRMCSLAQAYAGPECALSLERERLESVLSLECVLLRRHMLDQNALSLFPSLMSLHADSVTILNKQKQSTIYIGYTRALPFTKYILAVLGRSYHSVRWDRGLS